MTLQARLKLMVIVVTGVFIPLGFADSPALAQAYNSTWDASSGLLPEQSCPSWRHLHASGSPPLFGGIMTIATASCSANLDYVQDGTEIISPLPNPWVVEARVSYGSGSVCGACGHYRQPSAIQISTAPGVGVNLLIGVDDVSGAEAIFLTSAECVDPRPTKFVDTHNFHTYRIEATADPLGGANITVFYDGVSTLNGHTYYSPNDFGNVPRIVWGEASDAAEGISYWTYVRHNAHATGCRARSCGETPPGLVSWWSGDGNALDLRGMNNGSLANGAEYNAGIVSEAFDLNRSTRDYVAIPDSPMLNTPSAITLAAWVRTDDVTENGVILSKYDSSGPQVSWILQMIDSGKLEFVVYGDVSGTIARGVETDYVVMHAAAWQHVAATFDAGDQAIRIFVNGYEAQSHLIASSTVASIADSNYSALIGAAGNSAGGVFWNGLIDEAQLYGRSLSGCEVQSLYSPGGGGQCKGDSDGDGILDVNDNCPYVLNPGQENADGDQAGNACDCAPSNPGVFAAPGEVGGDLIAADTAHTLSWCSAANSAGTGTVYDVVRGAFDEFPVGSGPSEVCLASGIPSPNSSDSAYPLPHKGFWYLVRGKNACGTGTYGFRSDGVERVTAACP